MNQLDDGTPYYGRLGEVAYDPDEDRVQCHLCGEWFHQVGGSHLLRKHGWSIEEYRRAFRLPKRIVTCGRALSELRRQETLARIVPGGDLAPNIGRFRRDVASARVGGRTAASRRVSSRARKPVLASRPELRAEWHPTRNQGLSPETLGVSSRRVVWWRCSRCGHEWQATVASRAQTSSGCPRCVSEDASRRALSMLKARVLERAPERSLLVTHPELVAELHPTRNPGFDPEFLLVGSGKVLWWRCATCGHEWRANVSNRARGGGCPACSGYYTPPSRSLAALHPELLTEWHPSRNKGIDPFRYSPGSRKTVWWRCAKCRHEWRARIEQRAQHDAGCPECRRQRNLLAVAHPELAAQLHPTRDAAVDLTTLRAWSWEPLWWICDYGHEWQSSPAHRVRTGRGCPICARARVHRTR